MVEVENRGELVGDEDSGEVVSNESEKMDGTKEVNCELIEERIGAWGLRDREGREGRSKLGRN